MPDTMHSFSAERLYNIPSSITTSKEILLWLRKNEFYGHMQRVLLKVDRMSMAHGIEVRIPFLDKRIIDFCSFISPELGIRHRETKYLLKNLLKTLVPEKYFLQYKQGFSFDLSSVLKNELKEDFLDTLKSQNLFGDQYIDSKVINEMINEFYEGKRNY